MDKPMIRVFNGESSEYEDRPMTDEEYASHIEYIKLKDAEYAEREKREAAKAALLERLGITADEATLLLS